MSKNQNVKPVASDAVKASVALAVASLCVGSAAAATFVASSGTKKLSLEVLKASAGATGGATASTGLGAMTMTLGATYQGGDSLTLSVGNAQFADAFGTVTCDGTAFLSFSKAASSQTFRVPSGATTFGTSSLCSVTGLNILDSSVTTEIGITLNGTGSTSGGVAFDNASAASPVITTVNAYKISVATSGALSKLVDAKYSNKAFKNGATSDSLTLLFTRTSVENGATFMGGSTGSSTAAATIDILGDFTFLTNGTETTSAQIIGGSNSVSGPNNSGIAIIGTSSAITGLRLTIDGAALPTDGNTAVVTIGSINTTTGNALKAQTFATSPYTLQIQTPRYASVPYSITGSYAPGTWGQTGAVVYIPYMPVGSGINQVVYLANNSSTSTGTAAISMKSTSGGTCTTASVPLVANANTNLSDAIAAAIVTCQAAGTVAATDKLMITVTATTPLGNTEVYSAFTVSGSSRVTVVNSSNGYRVSGSGIGGSNADNSL